jgi:hypothetical protein
MKRERKEKKTKRKKTKFNVPDPDDIIKKYEETKKEYYHQKAEEARFEEERWKKLLEWSDEVFNNLEENLKEALKYGKRGVKIYSEIEIGEERLKERLEIIKTKMKKHKELDGYKCVHQSHFNIGHDNPNGGGFVPVMGTDEIWIVPKKLEVKDVRRKYDYPE